MSWLRDRLKEQSTKNGIAIVLTAIATVQPQYSAILLPLAGLFAGHAIVTPDAKQ